MHEPYDEPCALQDQLAQLTHENAQLQIYRQLYLLQQDSFQALIWQEDPLQIFHRLQRDLTTLMSFTQALVLQAHADLAQHQLIAAWPPAQADWQSSDRPLPKHLQQVQHLYDIDQCPWWPAALRQLFPAVRSALTVPIPVGRQIYLLLLLNPQVGTFSNQHRQLAEILCRVAGNTLSELDNRRLNREQDLLVEQQHRIEQSMVRQEKMAAIGLLTAGVAHELNNPLGYIYSNLQTMQHYLQQFAQQYQQAKAGIAASGQADLSALFADAADLLEESLDGARRARQIITQLRQFSHPDDSSTASLDLAVVLTSTLGIANSQLKHRAKLEVNIEQRPAWVHGNATRLSQLMLNLVLNACQAVPDTAGIIRIQLKRVQPWWQLSVSDNGHGISPEHQPHIFTPFFTTKPVGEGTGLGLSIGRAIAEQHGGTLTLEQSSSAGSTFLLMLPEQP